MQGIINSFNIKKISVERCGEETYGGFKYFYALRLSEDENHLNGILAWLDEKQARTLLSKLQAALGKNKSEALQQEEKDIWEETSYV